MKKWMLAALLPAIQSQAQTSAPAFISDSLDAYVAQAMKDYQIPGLSLALVKDGKVIVSKGYGVTDLESKAAVDENTLFYIASNTKLFTGMALSLLEERGKLKLDDPIKKYFPDFQLFNADATNMVSIRDMLSHRIGTITFQGDFSFFNTLYDRRTILRQMRLLKPSQPFRQTFGYCNSCFLAAGEVIPRVTGQPWEVFVQDSLINLAGMTNTHSMSQGFTQRPNHATPHTIDMSGQLVALPPDRWDNLGPAASIISNAKDMGQWLLFQLSNGKRDGNQLLPASVFARTRQAATILGNSGAAGPYQFRGYGLGVFATSYKGAMQFHHTGGASGMVSSVCFVPSQQLGVAILTNQDNQGFFEGLRYRIINAFVDAGATNTDARDSKAHQESLKENKEKLDGYMAAVKAAKPNAQAVSSLLGEYAHPLYGRLTVERKNGALEATFHNHGNLTGKLEWMGDGKWLCTYSNPVYGVHPLQWKQADGKTTLLVKVNDFVEYDAYEFVKR